MTLELSSPATAPFHLGDWSVAPDRNEIRRGGQGVRLEPLSMRLLCLLAENTGRTVSRAEIVNRLWGGRAVTDDAVSRQIAKLREAFKDDARRPVVIQTVPKVGVLLLPPVAAAPPSPPEMGPPEVPPPTAESARAGGRRPWLLAGGGLIALAGLVLMLGVFLTQRIGGARDGDAAEIPVTALVGLEQDPALSPSGAMLAYVSDAEPHGFGVYGRRVAQDDATRLTTEGFDGCKPAWSPEGDRIAFVRHVHGKGGCEIAVVSPVSSQTRVIARCKDARGGGLAWAGSAGLIFADRDETLSSTFRLYRAPLDGGTPIALTHPPRGSSGDTRPVYAPASDAVYFLRGVSGDVSEVFRLDLPTGRVTQVTRERARLLGLATGGPGRLLVSAANRADLPPALWTLNLRDGEWTRRATGGDYWNLTASADGRVVVFERPRSQSALVSYDPATRQATRITHTTQGEWSPVLSPRGDRLSFVSSRSGAAQVWLARPDGKGLEQLTFLERGRPEELAWEPDGRSLVMSWGVRGQYDLAQVDVQSGVVRTLTGTSAADERSPVFDLAGSLHFVRRSGADHRLIRRDPATGRENLVAHRVERALPAETGGFYVTRPEQEGIWRLSPSGAFTRVASYPALAPARNWTYREGAIWTLTLEDGLTRTDPSTGRTRTLGLLEGAVAFSGLDVRNGKVLHARRDDFDIDLYRLGE